MDEFGNIDNGQVGEILYSITCPVCQNDFPLDQITTCGMDLPVCCVACANDHLTTAGKDNNIDPDRLSVVMATRSSINALKASKATL